MGVKKDMIMRKKGGTNKFKKEKEKKSFDIIKRKRYVRFRKKIKKV